MAGPLPDFLAAAAAAAAARAAISLGVLGMSLLATSARGCKNLWSDRSSAYNKLTGRPGPPELGLGVLPL